MRHDNVIKLGSELPTEVMALAERERQIATFVYSAGAATAKDVEEHLSAMVSNSAIRSMLGRLVKKGIIKRRKRSLRSAGNARRIAFLYLPALDDVGVQQRVLAQVADDYFNGSVLKLAEAAGGLRLRDRK